ncbi:Uncharacterised protein [Mycobacteroides abscessus subsp. abscessus]|nr:Uncharacterised protein [Mycobacteroides abscessus subsp. abscessus]
MPMRPSVPIGAIRTIHHTTFWTTASAASANSRKGSAALPTLTAAIPRAPETMMSWRTLKSTSETSAPVSPGAVETSRPRKLTGMSPVRNPIQLPSCSGAWPCRELASAWTPGCMMRAMSRPMTTAMKAVSANHSSVETARRAALVTFLRLPMLAMIAVMMSGTTAALRRVTYEDPMVSRVCPSQLSCASLTGPHERATSPRTTPATRAIVTCTPKDFDHAGSLICFLSTAVPRRADALGEVRLLAQLLSNLSNSAN